MRTIVLAGYSSKNKEWGSDCAKKIGGELVEWPHWSDPKVRFNTQAEAEKILQQTSSEKVNVVAKSIGTIVLVKVLNKSRENINKIVLCGVPINDLDENDLSFYKILSDINPENIIVFQNSLDEHGNFEAVRRFLSEINPNIKIVEKPGSTHEYPYFDEFKEFLI